MSLTCDTLETSDASEALKKAENDLLELLNQVNFNTSESSSKNKAADTLLVEHKTSAPKSYSVGHIINYNSDEDDEVVTPQEKAGKSTSPSRKGLMNAKGKGVLARINKKILSASILSPIKTEFNSSNYKLSPNPMYERSELDTLITTAYDTPKKEVTIDKKVQLEVVDEEKWSVEISAESVVGNHDVDSSCRNFNFNKLQQKSSSLEGDVRHQVSILHDISRWKIDLDDYTDLLQTVIENYFGSKQNNSRADDDGNILLLLKLWDTVKNKVNNCPLPNEISSVIKDDINRSRSRVTEPSAIIEKYPSVFQCPRHDDALAVDEDKFVVLSRSVEELCHDYFQFFLYIQCICNGVTENTSTRRPAVSCEDYVNKRAILIGFFMLNIYEERLTLKIAEHIFDRAVNERPKKNKYCPRLFYNDFVNLLGVATQLLAASNSGEDDNKRLKFFLDKHTKYLHQYSYNVDNTNNCNHITGVLVTLLIPLTAPVILRQLSCYDLELYTYYKSCKSYNLINKKGHNLLHKGVGLGSASFELFCAEHNLLGISRNFIRRMEQYLHKYIQSDELSYFIISIYYLSLLATSHVLHTHTGNPVDAQSSNDTNAHIINNILKIYYHVKSVH